MPVLMIERGFSGKEKNKTYLPIGFEHAQIRQGLNLAPILIASLNVLSDGEVLLGRFENGEWVERKLSGEEINRAKIRIQSPKNLQRKRAVIFRPQDERLESFTSSSSDLSRGRTPLTYR